MRDVLPEEVALRDWAMAQILGVYRRHGFVRIETPAVESLRLLLRSEGGENEKLIYKILKRGEKLAAAGTGEDLADLGLRFDLTVPLVRYYANNHARLPQPHKAIQIGPVWRAERPQQGRYRQFTQCDIDILGVASEVAEIELILATTEALAALGLKDLTVRLNDRRILTGLVGHCGFDGARAGSVFIALDKLDKIGRDGVAAELREAGHAADAVSRLLDILASSAAPGAVQALLGERVDGAVWRGLERVRDTVETQAPINLESMATTSATRSRPRRAGASGCSSTRPWSAAWATTPGRSSRSSTVPPPRPSRAGGATIGWSESSSAATFPPPASPSASSAWYRSFSSGDRARRETASASPWCSTSRRSSGRCWGRPATCESRASRCCSKPGASGSASNCKIWKAAGFAASA